MNDGSDGDSPAILARRLMFLWCLFAGPIRLCSVCCSNTPGGRAIYVQYKKAYSTCSKRATATLC